MKFALPMQICMRILHDLFRDIDGLNIPDNKYGARERKGLVIQINHIYNYHEINP